MNTLPLGRLERVDLRAYWQSEGTDFTPWLAKTENIALLGDALRLDLQIIGQEKDVGPFRADILCKDGAYDTYVLIENQLERTDHVHLGQLLTYAAGLDAVTIVWIAQTFTEEHRAALDWLNEITEEKFNFFGLEIELWKIGDSAPAPKFNLVCKPNDWARTVRQSAEASELTETKVLQREYWSAFAQLVTEEGATFRPTKPLPQQWMNIALGRSGIQLDAIASMWNSEQGTYDTGEIRAEVVIAGPNSKAFFGLLEAERPAIEAAFGESLTWYNRPERNVCRIYVRRNADIRARAAWREQHHWLKTKLERLRATFRERIMALDPTQSRPEGLPPVKEI
jgi:hypothetical protein